MGRLCERPDCSEPAAVAYGMRPEDLVFWLDELRDPDTTSGVLCTHHADSMTVPRNWTLDDLRDPDLHLFRPPAPAPVSRPRRRSRATTDGFDQLELVEAVQPDADATDEAHVAADRDGDGPTDGSGGASVDAPPDLWRPDFDIDDDLDGLLSARSPLLARAFRGADRQR